MTGVLVVSAAMSETPRTRRPGAVLCDPELDEHLRTEGWALVPVLGPDDLAALTDVFWANTPEGDHGIRLDFLRSDPATKRRLSDAIAPVWDRLMPETFVHHRPIYSSFVVKYPGEDSRMYLHRDIGVDDERRTTAYSMWLPLEDVSVERGNGVLEIVPKSHQIDHGAFGLSSSILFAPYAAALQELAVPVTMAAGTALVYDARLIHGSPPNQTALPRLAMGCLVARDGAPVVHVQATGRRHRQVHAVDRDFFIEHTPAEIRSQGMPEGYPVIEELDDLVTLTPDEVRAALEVDGPFQPQVVLPPDLGLDPDALAPLLVHPVRRPGPARDVVLAAADLDGVSAGSDLGGALAVTSTTGRVGARRLKASGRRLVPPPAAASALAEPLLGRATIGAAMAVVDPGARVGLRSAEQHLTRRELVVLECPQVGAGMATDEAAVQFDVGMVLDVPDGMAVTLWNDGPGPLVVLTRSVPRSVREMMRRRQGAGAAR